MQFIDLKTQYENNKSNIDERIMSVLKHGQFVMGPEVADLEKKLADFVGVKHCISVSSGTDALLASLMALDIGPGDEVITTAFSFFATAEVIMFLGAIPVFVDIDETSYNINPKLIESAITDKTKAIMPVSLYGQCADMDAINAIANRYNLPVIEDAAQSFGAVYKLKKSCGLSTIGCTSFFPSKPLGAYGDGGACFTDDDQLAENLRQIRVHGQNKRYNHIRMGMNGRLDTMQAAVLLEKLLIFPEEIRSRQKAAEYYEKSLSKVVATPKIESDRSSVYAQYTIQVSDRTEVQRELAERGIPTAVHYPVPLHQQPFVQNSKFVAHDLSTSERLSQRVMSLPMHPYLTQQQCEQIADAVKESVLAVA